MRRPGTLLLWRGLPWSGQMTPFNTYPLHHLQTVVDSISRSFGLRRSSLVWMYTPQAEENDWTLYVNSFAFVRKPDSSRNQ